MLDVCKIEGPQHPKRITGHGLGLAETCPVLIPKPSTLTRHRTRYQTQNQTQTSTRRFTGTRHKPGLDVDWSSRLVQYQYPKMALYVVPDKVLDAEPDLNQYQTLFQYQTRYWTRTGPRVASNTGTLTWHWTQYPAMVQDAEPDLNWYQALYWHQV